MAHKFFQPSVASNDPGLNNLTIIITKTFFKLGPDYNDYNEQLNRSAATVCPKKLQSIAAAGTFCVEEAVNNGFSVLATLVSIRARRVNVTGPPGALLFDRDQRSH